MSEYFTFTFDLPQWVKLMFQEASTPGPRSDWMVETCFKQDFAKGKAMIELAQQQGMLPEVNPMDLLGVLSGALIYLVNVAPISERVLAEKPNSPQYIDRHINTLMCLPQGPTQLK
jgi:TetR/AcrR family transcriptional regulator